MDENCCPAYYFQRSRSVQPTHALTIFLHAEENLLHAEEDLLHAEKQLRRSAPQLKADGGRAVVIGEENQVIVPWENPVGTGFFQLNIRNRSSQGHNHSARGFSCANSSRRVLKNHTLGGGQSQ